MTDALGEPATTIPFNKPYIGSDARAYMENALDTGSLAGRGGFTQRCEHWLINRLGTKAALLTHSGTGALELAVLLSGIERGDEVIMSSFTFSSMANAVALHGGVPVFVDIRRDTLNLDENLISAAIGPRTRAIMPMHYAGIGCDMAAINALARRHSLQVIEDAAHAILGEYEGRPLGSLGDMAAFSFHDTKNIQCGEGGALLINDATLIERAEILLEKGTNRTAFYRGKVDKYRWVDLGSSFVPSEITAALLWSQLEEAEDITRRRNAIWEGYHKALAPLEAAGQLTRPTVPSTCTPNGHIYYVLLARAEGRQAIIDGMKARGVTTPFHYVPLHSAPAGLRFGRSVGTLAATEDCARRLLRLPLWPGLEPMQERVVDALTAVLSGL